MREPDLTRAAEKYLEQYGEPLVMNTYLKITVLALCAISAALAALVYRSQNALAASPCAALLVRLKGSLPDGLPCSPADGVDRD